LIYEKGGVKNEGKTGKRLGGKLQIDLMRYRNMLLGKQSIRTFLKDYQKRGI